MKYSKQDAVYSIQKCHEKHGDVDTRIYQRFRFKPSLSYIQQHFGTWNQIVRQAGFIPKRFRKDEELFGKFKEAINQLGYVPSSNEYNHLGLNPAYALFEKRGFTWDDILHESQLTKKPMPNRDVKRFISECFMCGNIMEFTSLTKTKKYCSEPCVITARKIRKKKG